MSQLFAQPDDNKPGENGKFNLITRSDMDGLVSAILLQELDIVNDIMFAHPYDMQNGNIKVGPEDITANLPFVEGVYLAFDHHDSETERFYKTPNNYILDPDAPSTARVIYDYYGGAKAFPNISNEMLEAVDKADSAQFTQDEILNPDGWVLLSFIMDARTGLGRFRDFNISNYQLMKKLIDYCREHQDSSKILALPDVKERVELYEEHKPKARQQIERCAEVHGNLVVLDLRGEDTIWASNRFMIYAIFPDCNISMHLMWGRNMQNTVISVGKSIIKRTSDVNVGSLMLEYGGGGHEAAGTCQVENSQADEIKDELIRRITTGGQG
jgi:nanoRNase/pAp phosphatase (c-di-AMP/oligoRNAs hydrolase)